MSAWHFDALGVPWVVDGADALADRAAVTHWLAEFDRTWSRFRADSDVIRLAVDGGEVPLSSATAGLFDLYDLLGDLTGGAVSPLVGDSLVALGYDASYSGEVTSLLPAAPLRALRREGTSLVLDTPATIDIGAAGKGFAVDQVLDLLLAAGPERPVTVDASGDLAHHGPGPALRVALEDPRDPRRAIGLVHLDPGAAIAASATNRRSWGDGLHHVLDARTGRPVQRVVATWAVGDTAALADGAATAAFFVEPAAVVDALAPRGLRAVVRLTDLRRIEAAGDLPGELFT